MYKIFVLILSPFKGFKQAPALFGNFKLAPGSEGWLTGDYMETNYWKLELHGGLLETGVVK